MKYLNFFLTFPFIISALFAEDNDSNASNNINHEIVSQHFPVIPSIEDTSGKELHVCDSFWEHLDLADQPGAERYKRHSHREQEQKTE